MKRENIKRGEIFPLKDFGNTLNFVFGRLVTKSKRISLKKLSFDDIISNTLNLSKRKTKILCNNLAEKLGKNMVDTNITLQMEGLNDHLSVFYDAKTKTFMSGDKKLTRSVCYEYIRSYSAHEKEKLRSLLQYS